MGLFTNLKDSINRVTEKLFADAEPKRIGIYGPPNAGKCLAAGESVLLANGTTNHIDAIFDSIHNTHPPANDVSDNPHETWLDCRNAGIRVPALSDDLTISTQTVSHVFRQRYAGPMYRVQTEAGRTVTVSPEHPFIGSTPTGIEAIPARSITHGTPVATIGQPSLLAPHQLRTDGGGSLGFPTHRVSHHTPSNRQALRDSTRVTWDVIDSIDSIDYDGYIYDLTVEEDHTFATDDGLFVHNTTLANRIARDWTGDAIGPESHVPHETRRARRKENVEIERNGRTVTIDIVDTPGVTTKVDYKEFLDYDMEKEDAVRRSREATEGVAEAMHWLREDVDGVIYVLDSTEDPFTQANTMLIGIIESRNLPVLIFANKIDLDESSIQRIENAFPQHETVPLSALEGDNMDEVYDKIAEYFG